ncbi:hypothetical protein DFH09DRAFT_1339690 [Mycena vulgaris]|nr:hypothetical protein DFH09DRAFT_1339690 [Mycena vulgaris]
MFLAFTSFFSFWEETYFLGRLLLRCFLSVNIFTTSFPRPSAFTTSTSSADTSASLEAKADDGASFDGSGNDTELLGVVKITSADPRAAARVAVILKQHDYDRFTRLAKGSGMRRRQKGDAGHGGGSVVGERVYSQEPRLLAQLLREAEPEVGVSASPQTAPWGKAKWKVLDTCFTDERIAVAARLRPAARSKGSARLNDKSPNSSKDPNSMLLATRLISSSSSHASAAFARHNGAENINILTSHKRRPSMEVPNFTPFGKRAMPLRHGAHAGLLEPVGQGAAADA